MSVKTSSFFNRAGSYRPESKDFSELSRRPFADRAMTDQKIYDEASNVTAEDGVVKVKGPDAVDVRLTPEAAEETSNVLLEGAMRARGQRFFDDRDKPRDI